METIYITNKNKNNIDKFDIHDDWLVNINFNYDEGNAIFRIRKDGGLKFIYIKFYGVKIMNVQTCKKLNSVYDQIYGWETLEKSEIHKLTSIINNDFNSAELEKLLFSKLYLFNGDDILIVCEKICISD